MPIFTIEGIEESTLQVSLSKMVDMDEYLSDNHAIAVTAEL